MSRAGGTDSAGDDRRRPGQAAGSDDAGDAGGSEDLRGPARRALLSVSNRTGLVDLARGLRDLGFDLVSTGGTARALRDVGLPVSDVEDVTGFPAMLDGRVKTLHPAIAGGILADLRRPEHREQLAAAGIEPFEIVVVNLYPFEDVADRPGTSLDELVEHIDVGGPTLLRAAAKNHASVGVITDPATYGAVLAELRSRGSLGDRTRRRLAVEAFRRSAAYDTRIAEELTQRFLGAGDGGAPGPGLEPAPEASAREAARRDAMEPGEDDAQGSVEPFPKRLDLVLERERVLRYGENPHQPAAVYHVAGTAPWAGPFTGPIDLRQGRELSYNNLLDAAAAVALVRDLQGAACAVVKHASPCGAAEADDIATAWEGAYAGDPESAFGGVVALSRPIDRDLAQRLVHHFLEVVVAPGLEPGAADELARRPGLRVLVDQSVARPPEARTLEYRSAGGAVLATTPDVEPDDPAGWRLVTPRAPEERERRDLDLAWRIARHVRSNAIVLVRDGRLVGVGGGQPSRVDAARQAVAKAGERATGAVCASDGFFPFPDALLVCAEAGVSAFVQPGGSIRDAEVTEAARDAGVSMLLTGVRHFRH